MAVVDFSNAHIAPTRIPLESNDVSLDASLYNASNQKLTSSLTKTVIRNDEKKLIYQYTGQFQRSGTEIYLYAGGYLRWHITGVTFNSWDTFDFKISANII